MVTCFSFIAFAEVDFIPKLAIHLHLELQINHEGNEEPEGLVALL